MQVHYISANPTMRGACPDVDALAAAAAAGRDLSHASKRLVCAVCAVCTVAMLFGVDGLVDQFPQQEKGCPDQHDRDYLLQPLCRQRECYRRTQECARDNTGCNAPAQSIIHGRRLGIQHLGRHCCGHSNGELYHLCAPRSVVHVPPADK